MNVQCYHSMLAFWTIILHPRRMLNFTTLQLYKSNFLSELYNFTYLTFFPKYLCHLLMQVSLLLAFPIKLFIKSTPIILSRILQTFLNSNWIRGTWHQKSLFSSKRDVYSSDPPSTYHPDGTRLGSIPNECGPPKKYPKVPNDRRWRTILPEVMFIPGPLPAPIIRRLPQIISPPPNLSFSCLSTPQHCSTFLNTTQHSTALLSNPQHCATLLTSRDAKTRRSFWLELNIILQRS